MILVLVEVEKSIRTVVANNIKNSNQYRGIAFEINYNKKHTILPVAV